MVAAIFKGRKREIISYSIENVPKLYVTTFRKENRNVIRLLDLNFRIALNCFGKVNFQKPMAEKTFLCVYLYDYIFWNNQTVLQMWASFIQIAENYHKALFKNIYFTFSEYMECYILIPDKMLVEFIFND